MNKVTVIASLLLGVFGLTAQIRATPQEQGPEIKQKVSKKARKVAAQASVYYKGSPQFAQIEGTSITYATNTPQVVINIGDTFYLNTQDVWLVAANAQGPWVPAQSLPEEVPAIVCTQINANPNEPYHLCALPW